ncbi:DJ-1/PfpI family protein [Vibrio methylphosphonaticus]|uniref:DJ-1/PfpI family protein n=1 Tax=Vibrio methylphosphonaticus TaxID=2946866 RepID=UPI00202A6FDA|nr:DJ-1/PfpI family protein [Vibrio methylphosphonaticus]MCL9774021.1 DJ-1/PfpI family protein [Vibrio methylphosphonaticus]
MRKILLLVGDFTEDYEVMVPYQALIMLGFAVDVVCPGKSKGESIKTAIHDFEGDQTYTEKIGHNFTLTASFSQIRLDEYCGIYLSGGRSSEYLRLEPSVLHIVHYAMNRNVPLAAICHGIQIITAANLVKNRRLTGYSAVKPEVEIAGGYWVDADDDESVVDHLLVTAPTWKAHPSILRNFIHLLGINIMCRDS